MTEILTESFCERCGTRYEFGAPEPLSTKQKTRGLVTGLRQFIMSQDTLSDSIGDAMRAEEETIAAAQIDAFQEAFNFCLDCRRYTCVSCWNDDAGRCRSCMPLAGVDDIAGFDERLIHASHTAMLADAALADAGTATDGDVLTWPAAERVVADLAWPTVDSIQPAADTNGAPPEAEPIAAQAAEVDLEPAPEPIAKVEVEPEPPVIPETAVTPPPAPPPAAAPRRDLRDTILRGPVTRPARPSRVAQPESLAARRTQLDRLGLDDPGEGTVPVGQREQLPYRSSGAGTAAVGGSAALTAVWDASTRALQAGAQQALLRPCGSCGLTVSSNARFCRRCGAPQTLSA